MNGKILTPWLQVFPLSFSLHNLLLFSPFICSLDLLSIKDHIHKSLSWKSPDLLTSYIPTNFIINKLISIFAHSASMAKFALTFIMLLISCFLLSSSLAYVVAPPPRLTKCPESRPSSPSLRNPFGCRPAPPSHRQTICVIYKDGSVKEQIGTSVLCICSDPKVDSIYSAKCAKYAEFAKKKN